MVSFQKLTIQWVRLYLLAIKVSVCLGKQKPNGNLSENDKLRDFSMIQRGRLPLLAILKSLIFLIFESLPRDQYGTKHPRTHQAYYLLCGVSCDGFISLIRLALHTWSPYLLSILKWPIVPLFQHLSKIQLQVRHPQFTLCTSVNTEKIRLDKVLIIYKVNKGIILNKTKNKYLS